MSDLECPYCGHKQDVCHDDGFGYEEDMRHEDQCGECEKYFVFTTSISFYFEADEADCLNGADHKLKPSNTYPVRYTKMACKDCDYDRLPTENEMKEIIKLREAT